MADPNIVKQLRGQAAFMRQQAQIMRDSGQAKAAQGMDDGALAADRKADALEQAAVGPAEEWSGKGGTPGDIERDVQKELAKHPSPAAPGVKKAFGDPSADAPGPAQPPKQYAPQPPKPIEPEKPKLEWKQPVGEALKWGGAALIGIALGTITIRLLK